MKIYAPLLLTCLVLGFKPLLAVEAFCPDGSAPNPNVLFCDSFEGTLAETKQKYYDYSDDEGEYAPVAGDAVEGGKVLRTRWQAGEVDAGAMHLNIGRTPLGSSLYPNEDFREIYWRFYLKLQNDFQSFPSKITRATGFAGSNWSQSMVAHVWHDDNNKQFIVADPVSGIENDQLVTTRYNDFDNFRWLGKATINTPFPKGEWVCIETRVKLNDAGQSNGIFEIYINDRLEASKQNMDWVGAWDDYAINAIMFGSYWGGGSPAAQERYMDALVVSKTRIGCISQVRPKPPTNVDVN